MKHFNNVQAPIIFTDCIFKNYFSVTLFPKSVRSSELPEYNCTVTKTKIILPVMLAT